MSLEICWKGLPIVVVWQCATKCRMRTYCPMSYMSVGGMRLKWVHSGNISLIQHVIKKHPAAFLFHVVFLYMYYYIFIYATPSVTWIHAERWWFRQTTTARRHIFFRFVFLKAQHVTRVNVACSLRNTFHQV